MERRPAKMSQVFRLCEQHHSTRLRCITEKEVGPGRWQKEVDVQMRETDRQTQTERKRQRQTHREKEIGRNREGQSERTTARKY